MLKGQKENKFQQSFSILTTYDLFFAVGPKLTEQSWFPHYRRLGFSFSSLLQKAVQVLILAEILYTSCMQRCNKKYRYCKTHGPAHPVFTQWHLTQLVPDSSTNVGIIRKCKNRDGYWQSIHKS